MILKLGQALVGHIVTIYESIMPELPEVEVARLGISPHITHKTVRRVEVRNPSLRWPVEPKLAKILHNALITHTSRRGKYLLVHCLCHDGANGVLMIHLGMSGSLRIASLDAAPQKHDHIDWVFDDCVLRYHDPRRFGSVHWHDGRDGDYLQHPRLIQLGIEPFDALVTGAHLLARCRTRKMSIKQGLLSGDMVVGVGNIYACEVLFRCKIHPETACADLTRAQCEQLAVQIKHLLQEAIAQGGSTLKDFVNSDGASGYFQMHYNVYGRTGAPCHACAAPIMRMVQGQRATFFCPVCQPASKAIHA